MNDADVLGAAITLTMGFYEQRAELADGLSLSTLLDAAITLLGVGIVFMCICRMGLLTPKHKLSLRLCYVSLMASAFCMAFSPWLFVGYPRTGALLFAMAVVWHLYALGAEWKHGRPPAMFDAQCKKGEPS